jgi:hypothetical protein
MAGVSPEPRVATGNFIVLLSRGPIRLLAIRLGHSARNVDQYPQAGRYSMKYLIVYEKSNRGWGAYAPDLPGRGAAGKTLDRVKESHPRGG